MPLIVVTGRPSVGKTRFADALRAHLADLVQDKGGAVLVVSDESLGINKGTGYRTAAAEKVSRATHKAAVERSLAKGLDAIVIADGLNYIKGYRYELWCMAKAAGTSYACVWVEPRADLSAAGELNAARCVAGAGYDPSVLPDLWSRFEPPDARNKWEGPMFRVAGVLPERMSDAEAGASSFTRAVVPVFTSKYVGGTGVFTSDELGAAVMTHEEIATRHTAELHERQAAAAAAHNAYVAGSGPSRSSFEAPMGCGEFQDIADLRDFEGMELPESCGVGSGPSTARVQLQAGEKPSSVAVSSFRKAGTAGSSSFKRVTGHSTSPQALVLGKTDSTERMSAAVHASGDRKGVQHPQSANPESTLDVETAIPASRVCGPVDIDSFTACVDIASCIIGVKARVLRPTMATTTTVSIGGEWRFMVHRALAEACASILQGVPLSSDGSAPVPSAADLARLSRDFERVEAEGLQTAYIVAGIQSAGSHVVSSAVMVEQAQTQGLILSNQQQHASADAGVGDETATVGDIKTRFVAYVEAHL